eukprot:CAMPEP_0116985318 /NCGR_PEP_ID=MMETSP0467-20121206/62174_1 /TAXON_ID=283647 /ORGANISM="Mesodinium pulex, Strain SPMC105" /LENGTH=67 /DNA_ID=CAMNT_0004680593 /DNA_START=432 /DNA_END=635 /DNA_ORIENTATION=+
MPNMVPTKVMLEPEEPNPWLVISLTGNCRAPTMAPATYGGQETRVKILSFKLLSSMAAVNMPLGPLT